MNLAIAFVGFIDLVLCGIVFKITFSKASNQKIVRDRQTKKVYMIQDNIKYSGVRTSVQQDDDDEEERDEDAERERVGAAYMSEFSDFGWEGEIVSQFI